ncbi:hypothetical protein MMC34_007187 [Xylographa carneopallida]|nr:hypothetical protein [Xylographa carneopallida]
MENEQVFEEEAALETATERSPPPKYRAHRKDHDIRTKHQETDSQKTADYEDTPLLSRPHHTRHSSESSTLGEEDDSPPPPWSGAKDFEGLSVWKTPSVYWLLPPFLISTLAFGGIVVPKLNLIIALVCREYLSDRSISEPGFTFLPVEIGIDNPQCNIAEVQALVANFTLYAALISGSLAAITSPKLGALSDRYGRNKVIAFTTCGMLFSEIITIITATHPETFSYYWLLLGFALDGLCGSFIAAMAITNAYAADCTEPSKRSVAFARFQGCLFTGIAIGPVIAGYIVKRTGDILSIFYIALGAHVFFLIFILFIVPESLTKERQLTARHKSEVVGVGEGFAWTWASSWRRFSRSTGPNQSHEADAPATTAWTWASLLRHLSKGGGLFTPLSILWPSGPGSSRAVRRNLVFLAAVDTTMFGVAMGSLTVVLIYAGYRFHLDTYQQTVFLSLVNTCRVTVLILVLPLLVRLVRGPASRAPPPRASGSDSLDLAIVRVAIVFDIVGYVGYATASSGGMLVASGAVAAFGGMGSPTLQSALTKHVPADRTGQLLGAMGLLHALARVVAPTVFNRIYAVTVVRGFPQAVFVCLAATFGVAFVLSWFIRPHVYFDEPEAGPSRRGSVSTGSDVAPDAVR